MNNVLDICKSALAGDSHVAVVIALAVLADALLGEPSRYHPLVGFGSFASATERLLYTKFKLQSKPRLIQNIVGLSAVFAVVSPIVTLTAVPPVLDMLHKTSYSPYRYIWDVLALYLAIGATSLSQHALEVKKALDASDLNCARTRVGWIVSRDTAALQAPDVCRAAVESVLENGNDAVFGAIFWYVLLGAPGAVAFRLLNTLDAMWGYKSERYLHFGWAAARLDDVMNWIPARLTALTYSLCGNVVSGLRCWRLQARAWYSPNAGPVMAAGAGSLQVELGGSAIYHGQLKHRPRLGDGQAPQAKDIDRAVRLVWRGIVLWVFFIAIVSFFLHA